MGGCAAVPVALASEATTAARAGFAAQGLVWLALLVAAVTAIRQGRKSRHAALMIAMAAVTSGAIWLRLTMVAVNVAELPFDQAYAVAAWACWLVPLAVSSLTWRSVGRNPARPNPGRC